MNPIRKTIEAVSDLTGKLGKAIDDNTTSKEEVLTILERLNMAVLEVQNRALNLELTGNALQRNWRPIMMYMFCYIIFHSILIAPILTFYLGIPMPEVPMDKIWSILQISISGYVIGRTGEKVMPKVGDVAKRVLQTRKERREERRNERQN